MLAVLLKQVLVRGRAWRHPHYPHTYHGRRLPRIDILKAMPLIVKSHRWTLYISVSSRSTIQLLLRLLK